MSSYFHDSSIPEHKLKHDLKILDDRIKKLENHKERFRFLSRLSKLRKERKEFINKYAEFLI